MTKEASILFPHQLFKTSPILDLDCEIYLVEEFLFFRHYKFHKQKIGFHRASMKAYEAYLTSQGKQVNYIESTTQLSDIRKLIPELIENGIEKLHIIDPTDNWLEKHINQNKGELEIVWYNNPLFINSQEDLKDFFVGLKKSFKSS